MKLLLISACFFSAVFAGVVHKNGFHVDGECTREMLYKPNVHLDASAGKRVFHHFDDAAFIHFMMPMHVNSACTEDNYGFSTRTVSIWADNGCAGVFTVAVVQSHCTKVHLNSNNNAMFIKDHLESPCYTNGVTFTMEKLEEYDSVNGCGDFKLGDKVHSGLGNHYGFKGRDIWADGGCDGLFKVCEVGIRLTEMGGHGGHGMSHMHGDTGMDINTDEGVEHMDMKDMPAMKAMMDVMDKDDMKHMDKEHMEVMEGMMDMKDMPGMDMKDMGMEDMMKNMDMEGMDM